MKAQILKIAGVKTEAEFYKKFPSEEAFMKKHGKELKKAQYGTYVAGLKEQPAQKPIAYDDLYQDTIANITGVSKEEKARQDELAAMQAGKSSEGGGMADILGMAGQMLAPQMDKLMGVGEAGGAEGGELDIVSSIAGALGKNGKKLKKAQNGLEGIIKPKAMPKVEMVNLAKTKGFGLNKLEDIPASTDRSFDYAGAAKKLPGALLSQVGNLIGSYQQIEQNEKDIKKATQWADISEIGTQAALSRPEQSKRRYARPEDNLVTGMNPLGKKDSLLAAQNGAEIANTFAPNDIYTDLSYEPLNDSDPKQYAHGGYLHKAQGGMNLNSFSGIGGDIGGILGSKIGGGSGKGGPGAAIGSTLGGALGTLIPIPGVGSLIGSTLGGLAGGLFDSADQNKLQEAQDRQTNAINQATIGKGASNLQQANKAFMENGGYMNPEYNPQVIAKFGDYSMDQLLAPPHDADMLRAGGHLKEYTPPSAEAMYTGRDLPYQMEYGGQMAMGGDLQVHRGQAETLSYNPFLPDGGETIMFRGPSHDNGGMPISYGQNGVEVEGGEPAVKLQEGGSPDGNLVVYGNMVIPDYGVAELGDKNAEGKKFKHYVDDLSKIEAKQNKLVDKTTQLINDADTNYQFDKLSLNTGQANLIGTTMKLKEIAEKKKTAAAVQNAILDTASEMGLESDQLAKGKIKYAKANDPYAKFGAKLETAQKGKKIAKKKSNETFSFDNSALIPQFIPELASKAALTGVPMVSPQDLPQYNLQSQFMPDAVAPVSGITPSAFPSIPSLQATSSNTLGIMKPAPYDKFDLMKGIPGFNKMVERGDLEDVRVVAPKLTSESPQVAPATADKAAAVKDSKKGKKFPWDEVMTGVNSILPFVRPSNQIPLDPSQLSGELYSLANNQEEPVFAQSYQPLLTQTSNISLQDQLNEITSQSRAAERMAQGNPAALAMIASQAAQAKNKVLGEQFRLNQGEAQRVSETNRQTMNEAQKMNLGLYDQQQQRAAQAKSNTKMQNIAALNSINDKIAKNKLENRQMAISENLYNYRFTPNGVAYNMNPLAQFNTSNAGATSGQVPTGMIPDYDTDEDTGKPKLVGYKLAKETKDKKRNGSIVKAIKGL
jgi:hypothetical protein